MRIAPLAACLAIALGVVPALADSLAVSPGLWETTSSGGPTGAAPVMPSIPPDQLARLTPEQRAMLQQRMAAMNGGQPTVTRRYCVTPAMLQRGFARPDGDQRCTRTLVSSNSHRVEMNMVCTGDTPATGNFVFEAVDAHNVSATMDMTMTRANGQSFPLHRTMQYHWIGPDCGDVKPAE